MLQKCLFTTFTSNRIKDKDKQFEDINFSLIKHETYIAFESIEFLFQFFVSLYLVFLLKMYMYMPYRIDRRISDKPDKNHETGTWFGLSFFFFQIFRKIVIAWCCLFGLKVLSIMIFTIKSCLYNYKIIGCAININ